MDSSAKDKKKKNRIIAAIMIVVLIVCIIMGFFIYRNTITAVTMRIQRLVGLVSLYSDGHEQTIREKMRLGEGQTVTTGGESLIMVSLDETKLVTLEENSRAEISSKGKKLELTLTEGNLFFNVTEKLASSESFDVNTSTMVCGIRGTSAYVGRDETGHETLMVTDGIVHVVATNPVTKEQTAADVPSGKMITVYLDEEAEGSLTISLNMKDFREEDLPAFVLDSIAKSTPLMGRVTGETGFYAKKISALAEVFSTKDVSMYGQAAEELRGAGIADSVPFMGDRTWDMVRIANMAADIAGDDLDLEIEIIKGYLEGKEELPVSENEEDKTEPEKDEKTEEKPEIKDENKPEEEQEVKEEKTKEETKTEKGEKNAKKEGSDRKKESTAKNAPSVTNEELLAQLAQTLSATVTPKPLPATDVTPAGGGTVTEEYHDSEDHENDDEDRSERIEIPDAGSFVTTATVHISAGPGPAGGTSYTLNDGSNTQISYTGSGKAVIHGDARIKLPLKFSGGNPPPPDIDSLSQIDWESSSNGLIVADSEGNFVLKGYDGTYRVYNGNENSAHSFAYVIQLLGWLDTI